MPFAKEVYFTAVSQIRRCLEHVHFGELDMGAPAPFVTGIVRSLARNSNAMLTLANLKSRDGHTYRHSVDVAVFATAFARHLGISEPQQHLAGMTGIFHDYGKPLTPLEILNAPRKLSPQEFGVMRSHVLLGYERLRQVPGIPSEILEGVVQHHEKHDGTGYPCGLSGQQISLFGRILSVCDVYNALASKRTYNNPVHPRSALGVMYRMDTTSLGSGACGALLQDDRHLSRRHRSAAFRRQAGLCGQGGFRPPPRQGVLLIAERDGEAAPAGWLNLAQERVLSVVRSLAAEEIPLWDITALLGRADPSAECS